MSKTSSGKKIFLSELDGRNTMIQFFIWRQFNGGKFSIKYLAKQHDGEITEVEIKELIKNRETKEKNEDFKTFYAFLNLHWQLFVLLDFMHVNQLFYNNSKDMVVALVDGEKKMLLKRPRLNKLSEPESMVLRPKVDALYKKLKAADEEARELEKKAAKSKKSKKKKTQKERDSIDQKKYMNPIYDSLYVTTADFVSLGEKGGKKQAILLANRSINDARDAMDPTKTNKRGKKKAIEAEPEIIVYVNHSIKNVRSALVYHRQLAVYMEWLRLNPLKVDGYAILPYMIEYTQDNIDLLKFLCVISYRRDAALYYGQNQEDMRTLDMMFDELPAFPYKNIVNNEVPVNLGDFTVSYLRHFMHDVLAPQYYICLWTRIILRLKNSLGVSLLSPMTNSPTSIVTISPQSADYLQATISDICTFLEKDCGYMSVGFEQDMIDSILMQYFTIDTKCTWHMLREPLKNYERWSFEDIRAACIKEVLNSMRVGASCLYKAFNDLLDMMMNTIMVKPVSVINTNNTEESAYMVLDTSIRTEMNITNLYNDIGLMESVNIVRRGRPNGFVLGEYQTCRWLSLGQLYNMIARDAAVNASPKDKAKVNRLLSLFTLDTTRQDKLSIYDQIINLLKGMKAYRPMIKKRKRMIQRDDIERRRNLYRNLTIGRVKELLEEEIANAEPLLASVEPENRLTILKYYRLVMNQISVPNLSSSLDLTASTVSDHLPWDDNMSITLVLFYDEYRWVTMDDRDVDPQPRDLASAVNCMIEYRSHLLTKKIDKLTITYSGTYRQPNLFRYRKYVLNELLGVDDKFVTQYEVLSIGGYLTIVVVIDEDVDAVPNLNIDIDATRVIHMMEAYVRRVSYVSGNMMHIEGSPVDNYIVDGDGIPEGRGDDDGMDVEGPKTHVNAEENGDMEEEEPEDTGSDKVIHVKRLFREYRSWIYMNDAEKELLYDKSREYYVVPYVFPNGNVTTTRILNFTAGLFGGTVKLGDDFLTGEDYMEYVVSIEKLIHDLEAWIQGRPDRLGHIVEATTFKEEQS